MTLATPTRDSVHTTNLYPEALSPELSDALFQNPTAAYRGTPFWSWNTALDKEQLLRQIDQMEAMGMGGFHMHPRSGLATEYLGADYMDCVQACVQRAQDKGMLAWLYDEDRWPSGSAGGLVTKNNDYRMKYLAWTNKPNESCSARPVVNEERATGIRGNNGGLLARYSATLDAQGCLADYRRLNADEPADDQTWYAYLEIAGDADWFNGQAYVDCMMPEAIAAFIDQTHEAYAKRVGEHFGTTIPAIFTDEPQLSHFTNFDHPFSDKDLTIPWTPRLETVHHNQWGENPLNKLPELFWESPSQTHSFRWRLRDTMSECFATAFSDQIGAWCAAHGIALTGHMMEEPTLHSQAWSLGECMRHYRGFQLPGIDMLCDRHELTTAKQAASVAHQDGRPGVLSELYGVTGWDFTFAGHKHQGDWQAALGVTVRVHHLNWVTMAGNAKRDYPAAIGYQSPWWEEYRSVEDHFARLNTALTRGQPLVDVAIIHPIESYWLSCGPATQTLTKRETQNQHFLDCLQWLLHGLIDADYVCESLLPDQCAEVGDNGFNVGHMRYQTVIFPNLHTIRSSTLDRLKQFAAKGGTVIFAGSVPHLVDAERNDAAREFARSCTCIPWGHSELLETLESQRRCAVFNGDGHPATKVLHQWRQDGAARWLFLCNTDKQYGIGSGTSIEIQGTWQVTIYDTHNGEKYSAAAHYKNGATILPWDTHGHDSLLLHLTAGTAITTTTAKPAPPYHHTQDLPDPARITLLEPNVLILDHFEWQLNDEPWQPMTEILRINNHVRAQLGWGNTSGRQKQPWVLAAESAQHHTLKLRTTVTTQCDLDHLALALERSACWRLSVNEQEVTLGNNGWWVDEQIERCPIGSLPTGSNKLQLTVQLTERTTVEAPYILGEFGVTCHGRHTTLGPAPQVLSWGDWVHQRLPFYGGSVRYETSFTHAGGPAKLSFPRCPMPAWRVTITDICDELIAFAPFELDLGELPAGDYPVSITVYGNRINTFGALHNSDADCTWWGPPAWFTTGNRWSTEYVLRPCGMLSAPRLLSSSS